jgi:hypothetical protein
MGSSDVAAYPESVNVLSGIDNDVRTPDKLIDGVNDTNDGRHMWLAPILPDNVSRPEITIVNLPCIISPTETLSHTSFFYVNAWNLHLSSVSILLLIQINKFYVVFDTPQDISMIHFWNYAKTANRGVREFQVRPYYFSILMAKKIVSSYQYYDHLIVLIDYPRSPIIGQCP